MLAFRCGEISFQICDKSESSFYFIQLINGLDILTFCEVFKKVVFHHENTIGPKSISQQELLLALSKHVIATFILNLEIRLKFR